jgi:hypothetical protein
MGTSVSPCLTSISLVADTVRTLNDGGGRQEWGSNHWLTLVLILSHRKHLVWDDSGD